MSQGLLEARLMLRMGLRAAGLDMQQGKRGLVFLGETPGEGCGRRGLRAKVAGADDILKTPGAVGRGAGCRADDQHRAVDPRYPRDRRERSRPDPKAQSRLEAQQRLEPAERGRPAGGDEPVANRVPNVGIDRLKNERLGRQRPVLAEQRGHPKVVQSSAQSHDEELQRRLWTVSEELTGVSFGV